MRGNKKKEGRKEGAKNKTKQSKTNKEERRVLTGSDGGG